MDAQSIDTFDLVMRGLVRKVVAVEWAGPGEPFSSQRRVQTTVSSKLDQGLRTYRLVVAGHPAWRGEIERVRFSMVLPRSRHGWIRRIEALADSVDPGRLVEAAQKTWKIELENEVRPGWFTLPNDSRRVRVEHQGVKEFCFSIGAFPKPPGVLKFRVNASLAGGALQPVFEETLTPRELGRWSKRSVVLQEFGDPVTALSFEVEATGPFDPKQGVPVWGSPVLLHEGVGSSPNVVLISIDTLRPDHLSVYGYNRQTSPKIEAWAAQRAVVFDRVIASAPWTLPSHVSIFSGIDAHHHGVNHSDGVPPRVVLMSEILRDAGYLTLAVTGGGFVHPRLGFSQGFDVYRSFSNKMGFSEELDTGIENALTLFERHHAARFFLFFHTYAVHNPFRPRQPELSELTGRTDVDYSVDVEKLPRLSDEGYLERRRLAVLRDGVLQEDRPENLAQTAVDFYDAAIRYTDGAIGKLLDRLESLGISDKTIVIITSDHGELFGEHGAVNHYSLYDENVLVPLIIGDPRAAGRPRRVAQQVRLVDILPTLCDLLGLEPPDGIDGFSLKGLLEGEEETVPLAPAISFASSSNYGISVREIDGSGYWFKNGAWRSVAEREEFFDSAAAGNNAGRMAREDETLMRLRTAIGQDLAAHLPGVRVAVRNQRGRVPVTGLLGGSMVSLGSVKILDPIDGILRKVDGLGAAFSVAPGRNVLWILEGLKPSTVFLELDGRSHRIEPDAVRSGIIFTKNGDRWIENVFDSSFEGEGVMVWWVGSGTDGGGVGPGVDDELRAQLEALGYVE
ncbi:MAG: sulfatase [Thermoanaerobaculales bacterium]|nr:sulfatase [Thermoanaerobaculales bacterium]